MEILVVSATEMEIELLVQHCRAHWIESLSGTFTKGTCTVRILITGVGMHRMAFALGRHLALFKPDLCVNAGVAGAFPGKAVIGDVVHVTQEIIADLGAEDANGKFLSLNTLGLTEDISSYDGLINHAAKQYAFLKNAKGITVNTVHGFSETIQQIVEIWNPDVESMEGGAFFYCCLKEGVPFIEIRAVSNLVEPRNKENWNIPLAVTNLNQQLIEMVNFFVG
jgi:futalosine hydrolase